MPIRTRQSTAAKATKTVKMIRARRPVPKPDECVDQLEDDQQGPEGQREQAADALAEELARDLSDLERDRIALDAGSGLLGHAAADHDQVAVDLGLGEELDPRADPDDRLPDSTRDGDRAADGEDGLLDRALDHDVAAEGDDIFPRLADGHDDRVLVADAIAPALCGDQARGAQDEQAGDESESELSIGHGGSPG
jgi:hypothetical protein